jgi:hypothetical protein
LQNVAVVRDEPSIPPARRVSFGSTVPPCTFPAQTLLLGTQGAPHLVEPHCQHVERDAGIAALACTGWAKHFVSELNCYVILTLIRPHLPAGFCVASGND